MVFDIDLYEGVKQNEIDAAVMMFHRRHVHEHNGSEVDQKYLDDSGDVTVRLKQALRETQQSAHAFANIIVRFATNLHRGFHDILPPDPEPIGWHEKMKANMRATDYPVP